MLYKDVVFLNKNYDIIIGDIKTEQGLVSEINEKGEGNNRPVLPLFTDIHIHGGYGVDIMNAVSDEIIFLSKKLYDGHIGAYMPTTVAGDYNNIIKCAKEIRRAAENKSYAEIVGIHIEGPFISRQYKGIMEDKYIVPCDIKLYKDIREIMGELKVRFTIAPECEGAEEFCRYVTENGDYISLGHSGATFEQCRKLKEAGAGSYTHLFNAMRGIHHRETGIAGAGLLDDNYVEVICDYVHISKHCAEIIARLKADKTVLVTDAMEAMGCENGKFIFCGKEVTADDCSVRDSKGVLAGSKLTMEKAVKNMAEIVGLKAAVKMAAENPAKLIGLDKYGCIDIGRRVKI